MTVTLASALRTLRMRPAATLVDDDQSPLPAQREKRETVIVTDFSPSHHKHSLISNLPGKNQ